MPRRLGPLFHDGKPHAFPEPALGVAYQYSADGLSLTIYVYDAGIKDIADGANTVATCEQFEEAKQGVIQARYPKTVLTTEQLVRLAPPDEQPQAREAVFEFEIEKRPAYSYVWVTGVAKHFIKLRFSVAADLRDEVPEARRAILTALGDAVKPHLAPAAPVRKDETSIAINSLAGSEDDMAAGMMYLMFLSAAAEEAPQIAPPCGGFLVPTYETELSLFRALLEMEADANTAFGKNLAKIEQAGFLEEFIWTDRHLEPWGEQSPEGLTLSDYRQWRKKNLKKFKVPDFGRVSVDKVRPLPVEAPDAR
jgi:hypothetical protein